MKKDLAIHFSFMVAFFILVSLFKKWIEIRFLPFWIGGIIGTLFPDIDYLIYTYVLHPKDPTAQKINTLIAQREVVKTWDIFATTQRNLPEMLLHKAWFQLIFLVFSFFVISSSGSLVAKGLVLAFLLHLLIDEVVDLIENKNLDKWFEGFPVILNSEQKRLFLIGNGILLLVFSFLL